MKNYLNTVLDFPKTVNEILPKNNFNELVDNSEKSIYEWIGQVFIVMALVFLVFMQGLIVFLLQVLVLCKTNVVQAWGLKSLVLLYNTNEFQTKYKFLQVFFGFPASGS